MNFSDLDQRLTGRCKQSRKVLRNTYIERRVLTIALRLHQTDILTFHPNNLIVANSGGWKTGVTKDRINQYLPHGFYIYTEKGIWYWGGSEVKEKTVYTDGDKLVACESGYRLEPQATPGALDKIKTLRKSVQKYVDGFCATLPVAAPSGGDCWYCCMKTQDGKALGDATKNNEHIFEHIKEGYYVPSLLWSALEEAKAGDIIKAVCFKNPQQESLEKSWGGKFRTQRVKPILRRYIYRRLGLAA